MIKIEIKPEKCGECPLYRQGSYQDMGATIYYAVCDLGFFEEDTRNKDYLDTLHSNCKLERIIIED